jgi:hypothetical protein
VPSFEREHGLPRDLLVRLSGALESGDPAAALRKIFSGSDLPLAAVDALVEGSVRVRERAQERRGRVSRCELELSLGVLLVLTGLLQGDSAQMAT